MPLFVLVYGGNNIFLGHIRIPLDVLNDKIVIGKWWNVYAGRKVAVGVNGTCTNAFHTTSLSHKEEVKP